MKTSIPASKTCSWHRRITSFAAALGVMSVLALAQTALAQIKPPLNFGNNFFVTGDYVVAGVGLRGLGDASGYAEGTITMPDGNTVSSDPSGGVPDGAQVVAAYLYWQTVESSQTTYAGQHGFFGPSPGGPTDGYAITGTRLGNPNAPVAWSSGGCSGNAQGSKTIRTYRANVLPFLPVDSQGNVLANGSYVVRLRDSGSNGGGTPLTLGATLVIIYRIMHANVPLNSIVIYDGTFAQSNSSSDMEQTIQGFYDAADSPVAKLTEIVGNGQPNKNEYVTFNGTNLGSPYGGGLLPPFPGYYDQGETSETGGGSWDNPTWKVNSLVRAGSGDATATVTPSASNSGCVSWGAVIMSTTVQDSDNDGLLDVWEKGAHPGYCDASIKGGKCSTGDISDPGWVGLPDAHPDQKDIYVQMDAMCRDNATTCDPTDPSSSFVPSGTALGKVIQAFNNKGITLHLIPGNAIPEDECTGGSSTGCAFPDQPGVVGWKGGLEYIKNYPLNYPDETSCEQAADGPCVRRFQHGRKDSYHYALFANALGAPQWSLLSGTITSAEASSNTVTFTTSTPHGLQPNSVVGGAGNGRVTVSGVISIPGLNGTFDVESVPNPTTFTIANPTGTSEILTLSTDPALSVTSGQAVTASGMSDIGGQDSLITLGLWGDDGETTNVQSGTFMHELGHSLGLTHGGFYYDGNNDVPTLEPNCKPNYQSVMNYLFQVDLLGPDHALDYSEKTLQTLDEKTLSGVTGLNDPGTTYSTTKWYSPTNPDGVGSPATRYCDGRPIPSGDPTLYRLDGETNPIDPAWVDDQDINFDGKDNLSLRGYDDWANIDLRQIGATGSQVPGLGLFVGGGLFLGGNIGYGGGLFLGGNTTIGGGLFVGGGLFLGGAQGLSDFTYTAANSVTRPPTGLSANPQKTKPRSIELDWKKPTFGQIGSYNIYRGVDTTDPDTSSPYDTVDVSDNPSHITYTDNKKITCGHTYTYFVTAILAGTYPPQESQPSNSVTVGGCSY